MSEISIGKDSQQHKREVDQTDQDDRQAANEQIAFERLIADIASRLAQTKPKQLDDSINSTLQALGQFLKTERAFLAEFKNGGKSLYHRSVWAAEGIEIPPYLFEMDFAADSPWLAQQLRVGKVINAGPRLVELPDESGNLRKSLEQGGIKSGVVVPVQVEGRSIGMLGLDNIIEPREYPQPIVDRLTIVADMIGSTLQRVRSQQSLIEELQFEDLISNLSATFVNIKASEIDKNIERGLRLVVQHLDLDRGNLFEFSHGNEELILTHSSAREGMKNSPRILYSAHQPWFTAKLLNAEMFCFSHPTELPKEAQAEREYLLKQGIQSAMVFPLEAAGGVQGGLTLSSMRQKRQWPAQLVQRCGILVQVFSNALLRKRADEKIGETLEHIRKLNDRIEQENIYLRNEIEINYPHDEVIGQSLPVKKALSQVEKVAGQDTCVLIQGETGTGKELLARAIHKLSPRSNRNMLKVNCGALPATLIESELFGREKGAFTGAISREAGRFEVADGSTIFLDEIGDLPVELQSRLLQVLEEGRFERLGSSKTITVDVRVIVATNQDLKQRVQEGLFRSDLYYRLGVFPISLPPLRERKEDIPLLVWHFVGSYGKTMGKTIEQISQRTMTLLQSYLWPGNIRELKNVIERAMIMSTDATLRIDALWFEDAPSSQGATLEQVEKAHILKVLESTGWRVSGKKGAAEVLGLKESTLRARMKKIGIKRQRSASSR